MARVWRPAIATRTYGTLDTVRAWLGGAQNALSGARARDLSLEDFVALVERAEAERGASVDRAPGRAHAAELSFPASCARDIVRAMSEEERKDPGRMSPRRRREVGAREKVDELFKTHALARAIARRCAGMQSVPATPEDLAVALKAGDEALGTEERRAEAAAMRGAYPGNRPCPCGSTRKFKRCCGMAS